MPENMPKASMLPVPIIFNMLLASLACTNSSSIINFSFLISYLQKKAQISPANTKTLKIY